MATKQENLRSRSGNYTSNDPLICFLYVLMRDHTTSGNIEEILNFNLPPDGEYTDFTNGYLAQHAMDIADRLRS